MTSTRLVVAADAIPATEKRARREVRAGHQFEDLVRRAFRVPGLEHDRSGQLTQVVRRNVGGHPNRDPGRAVCEQVREVRREHGRLFHLAVEVRFEVDRLAVDVA